MPSAAKRGISAASRICACSLRLRSVAGLRHLAVDAGEGVHDDAVGAIADGVDAGLEAGLGRGPGQCVEVGFGRRQEAGRARLVGVGLEQRRAPRSQRAVGADLDCADGQAPAAIDDRAGREERSQARQREPQHRVDARPQPAALDEARVGGGDALVDAGVVHRGQAEALQLGVRPQQRRLELGVARRRHQPRHRVHRAIDEHAVGGARRVADDAAANRIDAGGRQPGLLQRPRAGHAGVAVDARQPDPPALGGGVERRARRPVLHRPVVLIPAAADDPGVGRGGFRVLRQLRSDVGERRGAAQVELGELRAEAEHVAVRVVQPGQDRAAAGVDDARRRPAAGQRFGVAADVDHAVAGHRHRFGAGRAVGGRVDDAVMDDQIGGCSHAWRLRRHGARTRRNDRERHQQPHRTLSIAAG